MKLIVLSKTSEMHETASELLHRKAPIFDESMEFMTISTANIPDDVRTTLITMGAEIRQKFIIPGRININTRRSL